MKQVDSMVGSMLLLFCTLFSQAQQAAVTAATARAIVPPLVRFSGTLNDVNGKALSGAVGVTFALYQDEQGGAPLWIETQNVTADRNGHYSVMLGSTTSAGLPADIFMAGEAHWLGVQASGEAEQPRVLLLSVPYALKAGDAQTLGGLPASAFVLAGAQPTSVAGSESGFPTIASPNASIPATSADVTTTGGTVNAVPLFSTASNIQNSILTQPSATTVNVGGRLNLPNTGAATATIGRNSHPQTLVASAFNSSTGQPMSQMFQWQAQPAGNNTASPSATLNLLFGSGTNPPAQTGLNIASSGLITFATGQTFPGTGEGTITGVATASGSGLAGGGTSGSLQLGLTTACASSQVLQWNGSAWACSSAGTGTVTGVTAGTGLTGGGTGGNVTLSLNTTATNALYAQLAAANTFAPQQVIKGNGGSAIIGDPGCGSGFSGIGLTSTTLAGCNNYTVIGKSSGDVYLNSTSTGSIHFRNANGGTNSNSDLVTIDNSGDLTAGGTVFGASSTTRAAVEGNSTAGGLSTGVLGTSNDSISGYGVEGSGANIGVYGSSQGGSGLSGELLFAGVWGDTGGDGVGVYGTANNNAAGAFANTSPSLEALIAMNQSTTTGSPVFATFGADGTSGPQCVFFIGANVECSGTISSAVRTDGAARSVTVYAMQAAENWFEDAGSGQLSNGSATIALDPTFAETVNTGVEYHVFLTPNGDCKGLYVSQKSATSFEVHELSGGTSSIAFDYRIMAKRNGYENVRLTDVTEKYQRMAKQAQQRQERMALRGAAQPKAQPIADAAIPAPQ